MGKYRNMKTNIINTQSMLRFGWVGLKCIDLVNWFTRHVTMLRHILARWLDDAQTLKLHKADYLNFQFRPIPWWSIFMISIWGERRVHMSHIKICSNHVNHSNQSNHEYQRVGGALATPSWNYSNVSNGPTDSKTIECFGWFECFAYIYIYRYRYIYIISYLSYPLFSFCFFEK